MASHLMSLRRRRDINEAVISIRKSPMYMVTRCKLKLNATKFKPMNSWDTSVCFTRLIGVEIFKQEKPAFSQKTKEAGTCDLST